ncbi:long-chain fatty acid--CoA ligase [Prauserella marina]|uniref:Fatty-acyl-CoA synthase/long-chain acyl-CoA synthetase n=1 Tax=Prauserella marina TaxID=530584 RepID=A0A222VN32_9PSEU|nr:long-chain-fatty-acid--CoA ligase [Prauserella marina]ASR35307.1 long-chain fatty acid--CoA ligase [Prauserella marina]PWV84911.1 fatty-acyl-CoA synthase/long-chain acyl-CoA synthetase [Prauserella marina]SDC09698.1 fatty-acyl-CoA synthase/long-chain acyl-CoA synthetase [Prauserella marina]
MSTPARETPLLLGRGMTMGDQLARHARTVGDDVAYTFAGVSLTYRYLDERVSRLANALRERGIGRGDRVAVLGLNSLEVIETYFATTRLGAICVPVNFRLVADEIAYTLGDSGVGVIIVQAPFAGTIAKASEQLEGAPVCLIFGEGAERGDAEDYEQALSSAAPVFGERRVDEHDAAFIMYTSGTTGRPKGAVLSHFNLLMHAFSNMTHLGAMTENRVWLAAAPLFHIAGLSGMLPNLLLGGRTVLLPSGQFDPAATVELLERERVSSVFFVPAQWQAIVSVPGIAERDLSALRTLSWGAAPASTTLLRTMIDAFPQAEVTTAFGQTECSPCTTLLRGEDSIRKIGSVGTPMLNVEVRVVDDDMNDVQRGEVGEIVYRSPMVMKEYWNKPKETEEAFRGGWFHSGDLVREDEDGYYFVVDRKKDMIISGGENIYCAEVENVLAAHPRIGEVALIGVPDERWGETPLAVISAKVPDDPPDAAGLAEWCRDKLAGYKRPRRMAIVPALPRNPSGKVLKTELRADLAAGRLLVTPL